MHHVKTDQSSSSSKPSATVDCKSSAFCYFSITKLNEFNNYVIVWVRAIWIFHIDDRNPFAFKIIISIHFFIQPYNCWHTIIFEEWQEKARFHFIRRWWAHRQNLAWDDPGHIPLFKFIQPEKFRGIKFIEIEPILIDSLLYGFQAVYNVKTPRIVQISSVTKWNDLVR